MSFQAYIDNIKAKTGKTPEDFIQLAAGRGMTRHGEVIAWLKQDFGLGHGHAMAIATLVLKTGDPRATPGDKLAALFAGKKAAWRAPCDDLLAKVGAFGADVTNAPGGTYINLLRAGKKFAIVQPASAERVDVGIKLKGVDAAGRFEPAGAWNAMVTHRVRVTDAGQIDAELLSWLKRAHDAA